MMRVFNILNAHSMCIFFVFNILNHNTTFSQDWECGQIFSCLECVWQGGRFIFLLLHYLGKDQQAAEPVNIAPYLTDTADSKDKEQTTKGDRNQRGIRRCHSGGSILVQRHRRWTRIETPLWT